LHLSKIYLVKKNYTSNASRSATKFTTPLFFSGKHKKLSSFLTNKAGRTQNGRIIFRRRGSTLLKLKKININYLLTHTAFGFIASCVFLPLKNRVVSLILFSTGAACYYLSTDRFCLFSFFNSYYPKSLRRFKLRSSYARLGRIKKLTHVSCVEITPGRGAQYMRSPGTQARLIRIDDVLHSCLLELPSGLKKIFSYYSFALISNISNSFHKKYYNGKAGYRRSFGIKQVVRGVAMNAVDHPHGGRTKSVQHQRTPWGKTTKLK
jgi:large subunit ribosomal protein L2